MPHAGNDDKKDDAQPPKKRRKGARKGCSSAMQRSKQDRNHSITIEGYSSSWEGLSEFENMFDPVMKTGCLEPHHFF